MTPLLQRHFLAVDSIYHLSLDTYHLLMIVLPKRYSFSHKGDYGYVLCVGGSRGMSGAIVLAGLAALKTGAGLVRCAVADSVLPTVAALSAEIMTAPLAEDRFGRISLDAYREIMRLSTAATVVALGPGLGRSLGLTALVAKLYREIAKPMIVDADALNALAERRLFERQFGETGQAEFLPEFPRILTPHPGEFARLLGHPVPKEEPATQKERIKLVRDFAERTGTITLLKGHETIITDGKSTTINHTGNPGMATGGSGDVLTGIIAGLVAQHLSPWDAAVLGTHLHGAAGDRAAEKLGQASLTAGTIIDALATG